jgi:hypothetical protein
MVLGIDVQSLLFNALQPPKKNNNEVYLDYLLSYLNEGNNQNYLIIILLVLLIVLIFLKFYLSMIKDGISSIIKLILFFCVTYTVGSIVFQVVPLTYKEELLRFILKKFF